MGEEEYKCACQVCDCLIVDEYVNGDIDENGICERCFREHVEMDG